MVLDFNGDGAADFTIRFSGGPFQWPANQPLVWLNDGAGRFTALKVEDFLAPGMDEWIFASTLSVRDTMYTTTRLMKTRHGYSFIAPQAYAPDGGFVIPPVPLADSTTADLDAEHQAGFEEPVQESPRSSPSLSQPPQAAPLAPQPRRGVRDSGYPTPLTCRAWV